MTKLSFFTLFFGLTLSLFAQNSMQKQLQTRFIMVEDGGRIDLPEGKYTLNKSLWLDGKENIRIVGAGMDKTILSFKNQTEGAEGIKVTNARNIVMEGFTVQDTKGDAIKTQDVKGLTFLKVKTEWTGKPKKTNGAYGLYPVQCQNVLIDQCEAIGASDAGIYVGQSDYVVVKGCRAYRNVAGIEIENTTNAEVYHNIAEGNTGGILVFDLPGLIKKDGGNTRVYNNKIIKNNYKNFAPKGNIVGQVPPGTGILILAGNDVEIYSNDIIDNKTFGIGIASYYITEKKFEDKEYDPYSYRIYTHENNFQRKKQIPTLKNKLGLLAFMKFGRDVPDVIVDGIFDDKHFDENGNLKKEFEICIKEKAKFANLDAANNFENLSEDITPYQCKIDPLMRMNVEDFETNKPKYEIEGAKQK